MRKYIEDKLKQCTFADLSNFNSETNTFIIKKYSKPIYSIGNCYLIKLSAELLTTNTVVAANFNNNTAPKTEYLKVYITKNIGKMIYVDSIGFDINTGKDLTNIWSGYLPIDDIIQISEVR